MASEILLATRSSDKVAEIRAILAGIADTHFLTLNDVGITAAPAEEDIESHSTFIENALAKARYFAQISGRVTLAEDSGLMVDALQGAPGVRTKRFAIDHNYVSANVAGQQLDTANNELLLDRLRNTPLEQRAAHYVCAAALARPRGAIASALGTCSGFIAFVPRGDGGFGYDPLFEIPELGRTFAELSAAEKHQRSHRARAMRALATHT